jgi:hypothetical protein
MPHRGSAFVPRPRPDCLDAEAGTVA